ncbi:GNAT family N-acetyltransferase [Algoriphagus antarcticus]|uniref:RimJ/RimL family protein N-acetyltransferase n=1 Tax=Algoriphagus antarcticus TaxID=238540 RepID=A0A3E0DZ31_9BACT|nr:GNAT family protein [Algoriphagus antarcticus]REG90309.1 RimJ/RimL family protein N-acetyltransferase [Algoriphagus antarcticus]
MLNPKLILENERILLRPISEQDFPSLMRLANDPSLWTSFTYDLSIPAEFDEWARPALLGQRLQFVVIEKSSKAIVGSTAFGNFSPRDQRIEIGWTWLGRAHHGAGINHQMKLLMVRYCAEVLKLKRVELKTDVLNIPARNAMLKMGFVEEGILRSHTQMTHDRRRNTIYYSLLEGEFMGFLEGK